MKDALKKHYWSLRTFVLIYSGLVGILFIPSVILLPFSFSKKVKYLHPLWRIFFNFVIKKVCLAQVEIDDRRSPHEKTEKWQGLYMANHQSLVDVPLFMSIITVPAIMKKELLKVPFFGVMAWEAGCIPVDRKKSESRKRAFLTCCKRLKDGFPIHCYPEGTRSKTGRPKSFSEIYPALLHFAYNENLPITPVIMVGTEKFFSKDQGIVPGQKIKIRIYPRLLAQNFSSAEEFAKNAWQFVELGHKELTEKI